MHPRYSLLQGRMIYAVAIVFVKPTKVLPRQCGLNKYKLRDILKWDLL